MRLSTASTLLAATVVSGATLQARHHCFDFDSVCGPWTLTLDGSSWSLGIDCRNNNGANVHSKINMNECLGNAGGKLVSGGKYVIQSPAYAASNVILKKHPQKPHQFFLSVFLFSLFIFKG